MKASKQLSIVLAATVLAFGVATLAPQQADASYGYKYTDSHRPPVSYNDIAAYSLAVADYFMAKIMAIYGNGNTALNRYGFGK